MNKTPHFLTFCLACLGLMIANSLIDGYVNWFMVLLFSFTGLALNPDNYELRQKDHRWFLGHSILLPLWAYWAFHHYLNMVTAKELGIIFFFPVIVHLVMDLGGVKGYGTIKGFGKSLSVLQSYYWITGNIFLMLWYIFVVI